MHGNRSKYAKKLPNYCETKHLLKGYTALIYIRKMIVTAELLIMMMMVITLIMLIMMTVIMLITIRIIIRRNMINKIIKTEVAIAILIN